MVQGMRGNIDVGSLVWVEDPELAWIDGIVFDINEGEVEIQTSIGKIVSSLFFFFKKNNFCFFKMSYFNPFYHAVFWLHCSSVQCCFFPTFMLSRSLQIC